MYITCIILVRRFTNFHYYYCLCVGQTARDEIQGLDEYHCVGWLRVDLQPIKQVLTTYASKWMWTFTKYLSDQVSRSALLCFAGVGDHYNRLFIMRHLVRAQSVYKDIRIRLFHHTPITHP